MRKPLLLFCFLGLSVLSSHVFANEARDIMQKVRDRDDGQTEYAKQIVATCKYAIQNRHLKCVDKPRIKSIESVRKDYGATGKDKKSLMVILEPPSESGIGFLQYDYDAKDKDSDQWMYLSALGKIKRIVSGDSDEPKTGSLFGSEFSYEDVEQPHLDDFTYRIAKEETYQNIPCWVIESLPTPEHARKSNYSKSLQWIDKRRYIPLKAAMYDRGGRIAKQLTFSDYTDFHGIWVAKKLNMMNLVDSRISMIKLSNVVLNAKVDDQLMTQRTLTDGAFRKTKLTQLRNNLR